VAARGTDFCRCLGVTVSAAFAGHAAADQHPHEQHHLLQPRSLYASMLVIRRVGNLSALASDPMTVARPFPPRNVGCRLCSASIAADSSGKAIPRTICSTLKWGYETNGSLRGCPDHRAGTLFDGSEGLKIFVLPRLYVSIHGWSEKAEDTKS